MPRARRRGGCGLGALAIVLLIGGTGWVGFREVERRHPEWLPWTPLGLDQPVGRFTAMKLAALNDAPARCEAVLQAAGVEFVAAPPLRPSTPQCGYADALRLPGEPLRPRLVTACPVAAALWLWRRAAIDPAAQRHFGQRVATIEHYGSYECRRVGRTNDGRWSEHATADAIDISAFVLADGRRVTVKQGWRGRTADAAFLREVRDGACRLFATTLSPDYNAAHHDHFHLDMATRGRTGFTYCR